MKGWGIGLLPEPWNSLVFISPEVVLTNADIARAWPQADADGFSVGFMLTEEGALKLARLTKSHIGDNLAIIVDGRAMSAPKIIDEITGGRAIIEGSFTEEEAESIAEGLSADQTGKPKFEPGKIEFEVRLASYEKVKGWEIGLLPGPPKTPIWISPEAALTNADIARAWPQPNADGFSVGFMLTEEGSLKLARLTKSHTGENLAIMVDGRVLSAPKIMDEITGGRAVINGKFTEESAGLLAERIMIK